MADIKVRVEGTRELQRTLRELGRSGSLNAMRKALRPGASIVNKAMKAEARSIEPQVELHDPTDPQRDDELRSLRPKEIARALSRSIGRRTGKGTSRKLTYFNDGNVIEVIGPRYDYVDTRTGLRPSAFAYGVEFGPNSTPFARRAVRNAMPAAQTAIAAKAGPAIEQEAAKIARRNRSA